MINIIPNLMLSIFTNPITLLFMIITTTYTIIKIIENGHLYKFIKKDLDEISKDNNSSNIYTAVKYSYDMYTESNSYADINITSFIEEVASNFTYKKSFILEKIKSIKNSSSICILLGVLGTFTGLSLMLLTIDTKDIINSLPATISSMQTAFVTSIFGIVCSLIIGLISRHRDCEHLLLQLMLKLENLLSSEITHKKSEHTDKRIEDVKNTIKQISKSIEAIERFDKISKDLHEFNDEFISGIEALKGLLDGSQSSIKTFDQSVRKLDKQFNIMNIKFTTLFDKYDNQDDINKEILLDIKETSKNIFETTTTQVKIKDYIKSVNAGFALYERTAQDLLVKLINHENKVLNTQRELNSGKDNLDNTMKYLSNIVSESSKDIQEKLDDVFNYLDVYKEAMNISSIETGTLEEEIYEIEKDIELTRPKKIYSIIKDIGEDEFND